MKQRQGRLSRLNTLRTWSVAVLVSICPITEPALAQLWSGGSALGVQIRGSDGPVEGAVVEIRYRRPGLVAGPEARRTDGKGQANFVGITPGSWSLEIKHPEYLSFVASVNVGTGRKTEVATQFLEASGPGRKTFKVKFLRTDRPLGTAVPGTATHEVTETEPPAAFEPGSAAPPESATPRQRVASREAPAAIPRAAEPESELPAPERPEPKPRAPAANPSPEPTAGSEPDTVGRVSTSPEEAPVVESAEPPAPSLPPAAEQPASKPPPLDPAPEPEVAPAAVSEAEAAPDPTPPSEEPIAEPFTPSSEPQIAPPAAPIAGPAPPAPKTPVDPGAGQRPDLAPGSVTAFRDRTCFDCKPGEWAASAEIEVPGGEPCRTTGEVAVRRAMRDVATAVSTRLGDFAGPLQTDLDQPPLALASAPARNTLARYLDAAGACRLLAVVVPAGGKFTGFRLEARDSRSGGDCPGEQECEIGEARFLFNPVVARGEGAEIVYSVFENTGSELRNARMTGYFLPPPGWSPR